MPPHLRGQVVAQSILARPEAGKSLISKLTTYYFNLVSDVINEAVKSSTASQLPGILDPNAPRERVRKSRWSSNKSFVPGMPTILPSNLDDNQRQGYLRTYFKTEHFNQIYFSPIGN